jgi:hypothetical protein
MSDPHNDFDRHDTDVAAVCQRCGHHTTAADIIDGRCEECRIAEDEADWTDEAEGPLN